MTTCTAQLSFERLYQPPARVEPQLNRTVPAAAAPRLKSQTQYIYRLLKAGPVTTNQLRSIACQYNARISELRKYLREFGQTIDCIGRAKDGNNTYALRAFAGSNYQAELMAKSVKNRLRMDEGRSTTG
jgi:hypothetical protein